ncbi:MAG: carboxypeptidase-like regulatory domain-containing protein [Saprospiraceae bacterium]
MHKIIFSVIFSIISISLFSQYSISGKLENMDGNPIMGAEVVVKGTYFATLTDKFGTFKLSNVPAGANEVIFNSVDYKTTSKIIDLKEDIHLGKIKMMEKTSYLTNNEIFSDIVEKEKSTYITDEFNTRKDNLFDINNSLNNISDVFLSTQGGGYGDQRLSIRGYDQKYINFSLNGISLNDPETNEFNWASWLPLTEMSRLIQVEKGMGSSLLNNNAVGGAVNFITDCKNPNSAVYAKLEYGSGNNKNISLATNSGLIKNRFSTNTYINYNQGDGIVDKTWNKSLFFYIGAHLNINKSHELELVALNADQRHGQHLSMSNIAAYDYNLAKKLADDDLTLSESMESSSGVLFNSGLE